MCHLLALRTPIKAETILYLEGDGNYTNVVFANGRRLVLSKNIASLLALLPETLFLRLSKRHVINTAYMHKMHIKGYSRYVQLSTGHKFDVSRRRACHIRKTQKISHFQL